MILWGWGKLVQEKTRSKKSRDTIPLNNKGLRAQLEQEMSPKSYDLSIRKHVY
jgi:hypothetical protein